MIMFNKLINIIFWF